MTGYIIAFILGGNFGFLTMALIVGGSGRHRK